MPDLTLALGLGLVAGGVALLVFGLRLIRAEPPPERQPVPPPPLEKGRPRPSPRRRRGTMSAWSPRTRTSTGRR